MLAPNVSGARVPSELVLQDPAPLTLIERLSLVLVVVVIATAGAVDLVIGEAASLLPSLFQLLATGLFVVFVWSPAVAVATLTVVLIASSVFDSLAGMLLAYAFSIAVTMRIGHVWLILAQYAFLLVSAAYVAHFGATAPTDIGGYLIVAAVAGAVGACLRLLTSRGRWLALALSARELEVQQAILAERRRMAEDLHDSIAHDLTVITMHGRLLGADVDEAIRIQSRDAIVAASKQALVDLRRVIDLDDEGLPADGLHHVDFASAVERSAAELRPTGRRLIVIGDVRNPVIEGIVAAALSRILRESVTNILKYAAAGDVRIEFKSDDVGVSMCVRSPLQHGHRDRRRRGGLGLVQMAERARAMGGSFSAGPDGAEWVLNVRVPLP